MKNVISVDTNIEQLHSMFNCINKTFYDGHLSIPTINMSVLNKHISHSRYIPAIYTGINTKEISEIIIDGNYTHLKNTKMVFMEMLECAVFHYCYENNIKCASRGDTYKNKYFKSVAESHGLICMKSKQYGYKVIDITPEAEELFIKSNWCFVIQRERYTYGRDISRRSSMKYACECCGQIVRATKVANIICGNCNIAMKRIKD